MNITNHYLHMLEYRIFEMYTSDTEQEALENMGFKIASGFAPFKGDRILLLQNVVVEVVNVLPMEYQSLISWVELKKIEENYKP
jgi:hypothetical protein